MPSYTPPYDYLPLSTVKAVAPFAKARGVSAVALGPSGFVSAYTEVKGKAKLLGNMRAAKSTKQSWDEKREDFLARHLAQARAGGATGKAEPMWESTGRFRGWPTRRHLALIVWAYSPEPAKLAAWLEDAQVRRHNPRADDEDEYDPDEYDPDEDDEADAYDPDEDEYDVEDDVEDDEDEDDAAACEADCDCAPCTADASARGKNPSAAPARSAQAWGAVSIEDCESDACAVTPSRALGDLYAACTEYRGRTSCPVALIKVEGQAVELGSGAFLSFNKLPAGGVQAVLGYDLPEGEAYFHPLDPETKVYVLDGAVVLAHKNLRLTDRGLGEPPRVKGEQGNGAGPDNEVKALGPGADPFPPGKPWLLNVFVRDDEHPDDDLVDSGYFATPKKAIAYLRRIMEEAYADAVLASDNDGDEEPLKFLLAAENALEDDGEADFADLVRVELRDLRES